MTTDAKNMTSSQKEMNSGVAILLERMETNPEEFAVGDKWTGLLQKYSVFLNEEDQRAISKKLNEIMQQKFTEKVLEELADPKEGNLKKLLQEKIRLGAIPTGAFGSPTIKAEGGTVTYSK
jgi:hypothetical protein